MKTKYFTMGIKEINKERWMDIQNRTQGLTSKPLGGLWSCEYKPDDRYITTWAEFCDENIPNSLRDYGVSFELKEDAKVYTIDSYEDLSRLHSEYPLEDTGSFSCIGTKSLDFESIAKQYDAIYLTDEGQWATRFVDINMYGWDIECILVLNYDSIVNKEYIGGLKWKNIL